MDIDSWTTTSNAADAQSWAPVDHPRSEKLGKVYVTPTTKAILGVMGEKHNIGASGIAALLIEELRHQGQLQHVWKAHRNRRRKALYRKRYGAQSDQ